MTDITITDISRSRLKKKRQYAARPPYTLPTPWLYLVLIIAAFVVLPVFSLLWWAFHPTANIWPHLMSTVLPGAIWQTSMLMLGVGLCVLVIGTITAWLVTMYQFPGHKVLDWMLLIPLAMPTYIIAFCYVELLDYSGTLQTSLRFVFGWQNAKDYWFPEIRSLGGAIFVMSFVLYPYVYLNARASFIQQSICVLEVARTLGHSPLNVFYTIALPLARPALIAGLVLALMECLNDIGAVEYLGVYTLTVNIYTTWIERANLPGAAQLASVMLVFVVVLFTIERKARRGQQYHHTTGHYRMLAPQNLNGLKAWIATFICFLPIVLGFILPVTILIQSSFVFAEDAFTVKFWSAVQNSFFLSAIAAVIAVSCAVILAYARRVTPTRIIKPAFRIAGIGYAIPGTVLAVGLLSPLAYFDNTVDDFMRNTFGISTGLILSGSAFAIVLAYSIRFLVVSTGAVEAGLKRISVNLDAASRSLGETSYSTLKRVHFPMLQPALATAALLVFVDAMKELPATLLLRPFNFDTLATHVYMYASLAQFEEAAFAALTIVVFGLIPVILLSRTIAVGRVGSFTARKIRP
ncbi:MAG: iron ABC transporter permease [Pseudomonadota bacterium]